MAQIPRDPETAEVLPCGDTMWADMTVAFEDLGPEEKEEMQHLKVRSFSAHTGLERGEMLRNANRRWRRLLRNAQIDVCSSEMLRNALSLRRMHGQKCSDVCSSEIAQK